MPSPEFHFKNKAELLNWFQKELPESYSEYLLVKERVRKSGFTGSLSLLKREAKDETIENFLTFLTELNIASLLICKGIKNLRYEPKEFPGVDFAFDNILISVKNLNAKNYEKKEHEEIERMRAAGGGKNTLQHKRFSETFIQVEKKPSMGTFSYSRTETGNSGFLNSDIDEMSPALENIGKFEAQANKEGYKKVLFTLSYTSEFRPYHAIDIGHWYFNALPTKNYRWIFGNDPNWYLKLLKKPKKDGTVSALIFMFPPNPLIWPPDCFKEVIKNNPRILPYSRDEALLHDLKLIFS